MHFGEANDANEATPPWIQDLSFDIELVSFREANLKITTSKMGQISMSMDANGISVKFGVTNQWKSTWANHGQSAAAADAGGEGHGPHRLEFTDGEGWNVMGFLINLSKHRVVAT